MDGTRLTITRLTCAMGCCVGVSCIVSRTLVACSPFGNAFETKTVLFTCSREASHTRERLHSGLGRHQGLCRLEAPQESSPADPHALGLPLRWRWTNRSCSTSSGSGDNGKGIARKLQPLSAIAVAWFATWRRHSSQDV